VPRDGRSARELARLEKGALPGPLFREQGLPVAALVLQREEWSPMPDVAGIAAEQLRLFVDKIERLEEEKKELQETIKEAYAEAKGEGFDVKILRKLISLRKMRPNDRQEQDELLDLYKAALGMI